MSRRLTLLLALALLGVLPLPAAYAAPPPIRHVFVIVLENEDATKTFGADSPAPFLAKALPAQGLFVPGYYGIGHQSLDNYIAMVSGQAPNPQTQADCQAYTDFVPGTMGDDGQALGTGCVYPAAVKTIADQLQDAGLSWKGYMEDMGADPARDGGTTCAHPPLGQRDPTQTASAKDQYAARHNPFVYFHSLVDGPSCAANDVPLDRLSADLASAETTPNLAFITPDLCDDGHDATCADGGLGGLPAADAFLRQWVPRITSSPAFRDGLLIVTFDEAGTDSSACCGEPTGPNTPTPGGLSHGPGGGRTGAVLLSPYITPGGTTTAEYNHYSLLRSIEDLFALPHLGYAGMDGLAPFGDDVYTNPAGSTPQPVFPAAPAPAPPAKAPGCRARSLRGAPRHLAPGTLLHGLRLIRDGGGRTVAFKATRYALVDIRDGGRRVRLRVRACRGYRVSLGRAGGRATVIALSGRHAERRRLG